MSPTHQQSPVEDDGTVKYVSGPGSQPQAPFGPPPGVPISPFDGPPSPMGPGMSPVSSMPASGMPGMAPGMPPASGVPVSGMPPASGVPVSPGRGQFGPQGGQLVPVSGAAGPAWGGAQPGQIQRKKKGGGKGPLWFLLIGIVVIAGALGVGGFILFNPGSSGSDDQPTGTIQTTVPAAAELSTFGNEASGLSFLAGEGWAEATEAPAAFADASGATAADESASVFVGTLDAEGLGLGEDADIAAAGGAFDAALAEHLGGAVGEDLTATPYRVDARAAEFHTFTVGDVTVLTAVIETDAGYVGYAGFAPAEQLESVEQIRNSLSFGE
ncbi:hypothetical protein [Glycomyces tarimensis]